MAIWYVPDLMSVNRGTKGCEFREIHGIVRHDPVRVSLDAEVVQVPDHTQNAKLLSTVQEFIFTFHGVFAIHRKDLWIGPGFHGLECKECESRHAFNTVCSYPRNDGVF